MDVLILTDFFKDYTIFYDY